MKLVGDGLRDRPQNQLEAGNIDFGYVDPWVFVTRSGTWKSWAQTLLLALKVNLDTGIPFSNNYMNLNFR